jgi:hypothetical protein
MHELRQELHRYVVRAGGGAVREGDAEPELLDEGATILEEGSVLAMATTLPCYYYSLYL